MEVWIRHFQERQELIGAVFGEEEVVEIALFEFS
jgi:hypothetical protein